MLHLAPVHPGKVGPVAQEQAEAVRLGSYGLPKATKIPGAHWSHLRTKDGGNKPAPAFVASSGLLKKELEEWDKAKSAASSGSGVAAAAAAAEAPAAAAAAAAAGGERTTTARVPQPRGRPRKGHTWNSEIGRWEEDAAPPQTSRAPASGAAPQPPKMPPLPQPASGQEGAAA